MARSLRIEYAGAVYHAMARGNQGCPIFKDDQDRRRFLETLAEVCEKTGWRIHAYVLMGNHYHLLVETPEANLVAGMKWLQGTLRSDSSGVVEGKFRPLGCWITHGLSGKWVVNDCVGLWPAADSFVGKPK